LRNVAIQGLDLRAHEELLISSALENTFFLGCQLSSASAQYIYEHGGIIFPFMPSLPFNPFRPSLYHIEELLEGYVPGDYNSFFKSSVDGNIYRCFKETKRNQVISTLLERIHDHAIDDALEQMLSQEGRRFRAVGIMGGHSCKRDNETFRTIAKLGYRLTQSGYFVVTGGGPGAMEAANLGAYLSPYPLHDLEAALNVLQEAPSYKHPRWFDSALEIRKRWPNGADSLGVPTWFYGHEPSNLFATFIAKYFANSIREEGILSICFGGIIYAPGSAGTIQEIFQDACQNHYGTCKHISSMIFFDTDYWTKKKEVYPLLQNLSRGKTYHNMLGIYDHIEDVITHLKDHPPIEIED
ncbi:MAG: hypothetical protein VX278_06805, partial [Myxococcota bacterium]|nr:hypothetical protein [Myxococcota bacterium]